MIDPETHTTDSTTDPAEVPTGDTVDSLLDQFIELLTPAHHASAAVPYASIEVAKADLRSAARTLMQAAQALPPIEDAAAAPPVSVAPPVEVRYHGELTGVSVAGVLSGWAMETAEPVARVIVQLVLDGLDLGPLHANEPTQAPATGDHGFLYQFHGLTPGPHTVRVLLPDGSDISGSPLEFTV